MAQAVRLPRMSDTMAEGVIAELNIEVGSTIEAGDVLAEVETDKATMEWESFVEGTILHVEVSDGDTIPVNGLVAIIGEEGEDFASLLEEERNKKEEHEEDNPPEEQSTKEEEEDEKEITTENTAPKGTETNGRLKVSPLARSMAKEQGIDLSSIEGSGEDGRIVKKDIEKASTSQTAKAEPKTQQAAKEEQKQPAILRTAGIQGKEGHRDEKVSMMRKTIARRLGESKFTAPHFYLTMKIDMTRTIEERKRINEIAPLKISFNDLVVKAAAMALRQHPEVNASWLDNVIRYYDHIHIGMAVAVDEGLVVPVIRFVDGKPLSVIAAESNELADKARSRNLTTEEMQGNTFSISNLGMMGIEEFTAVINPPDSCILAVGGINPEVYLNEDGEAKERHIMRVTLSCDHRVVDGAVGSRFLQTFKGYLEDPVRMLV